MSIGLESLSPAHWPDVRRIYSEGIATGNATFETECPEWSAWDTAHLDSPRLVAIQTGLVIGFAVLSAASQRRVYSGVAEVSLYVQAESRGRGVGRLLLGALIERSESQNIWTLQAGIFPENLASIVLHKRCGFREVGRRERIAQLAGIWRDVILLERRSKVAGR